ncbi:MAG: DUF2807 domain-containing protein [Bacteroidales bacterium]|nr:DUF2807 domain-containing protein [Bacteroidales bacterium]
MKKNSKYSLIITFSISVIIILIGFAACNIACIQGNGNVVKNERETATFSSIDVSGAFNVVLTQDSITSVSIEADENLHAYIITKVENNNLFISNDKPICGSKDIILHISSPNFEKIDLSGAVDVKSVNKISVSNLSLDLSGACEIELDLSVQNLNMDCSGSVDLSLSGNAANVNLDVSGASEIEAYELLTDTFSISSSGASEAKISVSKQLDVDISGAGSVLYKGSPSINQEISGAGSIKKED